ncbi:MAG: hypothetical protein QOF58_4016 [Pseudonocardiales bacterium]|nr:hypothetical protein [Pseudonocardiales bacterium]
MTEDEVFWLAVGKALQEPEVRESLDRGVVTERGLRTAADRAKPVITAATRRVRVAAEELDRPARLREEWSDYRGMGSMVLLVLAAPVAMWWLVILAAAELPGLWRIGLAAGVAPLSAVVLVLTRWRPRGVLIARSWIVVSSLAPALVAFYLVVGHWNIWWYYPVFAGVAAIGSWMSSQVPPESAVKPMEAASAQVAWHKAMVSDGVLPVFRAEINSAKVVHSATLTSLNQDGLAGRVSLVHQPTPAGERLAELVRSATGGSFALAGPRGAGKTSLLRAFEAGAYAKAGQPPDLSVFTSAPVEYAPREFLLDLYAETCCAVLKRQVSARLRREALAGLASIAYVMTYSGEKTGKFGVKGVEFGWKGGLSVAGRALTYPEVVRNFRGFVASVAAELDGQVVIAIDEIDRIGAGEPARRFLNELKAIFDLPGCFYLVSVSTEAQHDFELSGMGLRSVFDSSFDEVVRVEYLDFTLAKGLLRRLVVGLPEQFVALAYVFSGGLARQLVRAARAIVREPGGTQLAAVAGALVDAELERVCKTTGDALTASGQDGVGTLLRELLDPQADLHGYRKAVQAAYDGEDTAIKNLRDLAAARIEFLAVVRDYFTNDLAEVVPAQVNALARARRYAGSNPATGLALLEEFSAETPERPAPEQPPR